MKKVNIVLNEDEMEALRNHVFNTYGIKASDVSGCYDKVYAEFMMTAEQIAATDAWIDENF